MNKQVTKLFTMLVNNGLFDGVEKVALLDGYTTKIHATPNGGLTIYADYAEREVALSVYQRGPDHAGMAFPTKDRTNRVRLAEGVLKAALRKLAAGELNPRRVSQGKLMYSSEIERMFKQAMGNGLFKREYPVLALVYGYEILIKASSFEGIEIYSSYPSHREFAVMHDGASLEGFGTGFTALELKRLMEALVEKTALDNLVIDHTNGPGVPLSIDRFRQICTVTSSRKIGEHSGGIYVRVYHYPGAKLEWVLKSPFLNFKRTLDQWFKGKCNG